MAENNDHGESPIGHDAALDGTVKDGVHRYRLRVYHADTDMSGPVYHGRYLEWLERGRSDYLRAVGIRHSVLKSGPDPRFWVVSRLEIDYRRPAQIEDVLDVSTRVAEAGKARMVMVQSIALGDVELTRARVSVALINAEGRPQRLDPELIARFRSNEGSL